MCGRFMRKMTCKEIHTLYRIPDRTTPKSVQSEAASASSPTPISHQLTSDVIRGARVLWHLRATLQRVSDSMHIRQKSGAF